MVAITGRRRIDTGRLVMIPAAAALLVLDAVSLVRGTRGAAHWLGAALICAFYALVIWCYLRRGPARATSGSVTAHAAAVTATVAPFAIPLVRGPAPGPGWQAVSDALLVAGTAWALWSLRWLGRNLSVLAQARSVADRGPYRWVRHPLYTGEITSSLGLALTAHSPAALGIWLAICALQGYRALREEQVLLAALPGYRAYRGRTAALLPGVF
jgi:protein-S-isoprenylcysteine O-methyltransferase Ste14